MKAIERMVGNLSQRTRIANAVGSRAVSIVQGGIMAGRFTPNAPLTKAVKQGDKVLRDRGQLISSIAYKVEGNVVIVGTKHPAARLLHYGGVLTARNARYLAIPAGARTRGLMRSFGHTPRDCIEGMKNAGYSVWVSKAKSDGGVILARKGKRGEEFVLFILRRSVKIPARPFMRLGEDGKRRLAAVVLQELKR